jgi:hypothetical protein
MSEWWTYSLRDFLLFSPRTYQRLIERCNAEVWPAQWVGTLACLAIVAMLALRVPHARRIATILLAAMWAAVAWDFLWQRYATINWVATYMAAAFGLQSALLITSALGVTVSTDDESNPARSRPNSSTIAGFAMLLLAVAYPCIAAVSGSGLDAAEWFGVMPDPTVIGTLGALVLMRGFRRWRLLAIPLAWCALGAATAWLLKSPTWWLLTLAGAIAVGAVAADRPSSRRADDSVR